MLVDVGFVQTDETPYCIDVGLHTVPAVHCFDSNPGVDFAQIWPSPAIETSLAAVALGATWIERHVTLDRSMWGSDQSSSIEPDGLIKLVKGIRSIEKATQYEPGPRKQFEGENSKKESLRKKV